MQGPLDITGPIYGGRGSPGTRPRSHPLWHTCEVLSDDHTFPRMEIHVYLRREIPTDDLGRTTTGNWGPTIPKYHEGYNMEYVKKPRTYPHTRRVKQVQESQHRETVPQDRFWWMRPDGITVLPPIGNKAGVFCILDSEYKRMSDVTDQYLLWDRLKTENQYYVDWILGGNNNKEGHTTSRVPSKCPQGRDTSPRVEDWTNQLHNGGTVCERTGPTENLWPEILQSPGG